MSYLFTQIFLCLLVAFLLGLLIGWLIFRNRGSSRLAEQQAELDDCRERRRKYEQKIASLEARLAEQKAAGGAGGAARSFVGGALPKAVGPADDLKKIWGIGPRMESLLNGSGITTFAQLSAISVERLRDIIESWGSKRLSDLANEETWAEQADLASRGDWNALSEYQAQLSWRDGGGKPTG